jgi:NAD(P)H-hydrate repair Nnr-like enzyme with NAD(P)H-hydrate dehydratase domain
VAGDCLEAIERGLGGTAAVLIGPGLDDIDQTAELIGTVAGALAEEVPVVLDAYAIGALGKLPPQTLAVLADRLLLTPNHTELARLLEAAGDSGADGESGDGADGESGSEDGDPRHRLAVRYRAVLSSDNHIVTPDGDRWLAPAGHTGLGTSGSGDVQAGALAGLLARGVPAAQAACWATYLHAASGDRLAARVGSLGFLARELLEELPLVLTELQA